MIWYFLIGVIISFSPVYNRECYKKFVDPHTPGLPSWLILTVICWPVFIPLLFLEVQERKGDKNITGRLKKKLKEMWDDEDEF